MNPHLVDVLSFIVFSVSVSSLLGVLLGSFEKGIIVGVILGFVSGTVYTLLKKYTD
jgi:ABC-type microcin C transport system permease subunit YejE